jgi:hypothetical protein
MARNIANPIGELSGSVNGQTFARNKSGTIVRQKFSPCNPNTLKQAKNRTRFSSKNGAWHTLSDSQKQLWNEYAKQRNNTGLNEFISLNLNISALINNYINVGTFNYRFNNTGLVWSITRPIYNIKVPPKQPYNTAVNSNFQVIKFIDFSINPTPPNPYAIRIFMNDLSSYTSNFTSQNVFVDALGQKFGFIVYFRPLKAQKSSFQSDDNFEVLFSLENKNRNGNIATKLSFIQRNFIRIDFLNALKDKIRIGIEYELQFVVQSESGLRQIINNQFFTFT